MSALKDVLLICYLKPLYFRDLPLVTVVLNAKNGNI